MLTPVFTPYDGVFQMASKVSMVVPGSTFENALVLGTGGQAGQAAQTNAALNACLASPTCQGVTRQGNYLETVSGGTVSGWTSNPVANTYNMITTRQETCNNPNLAQPYLDTCVTSWCINNPGNCDDMMQPYCKANPTAPQCACINSPLTQYAYNPYCQDQNCINNGYATASMVASKEGGCTIIDCKTAATIINNGGIQLSDNTVTQRCTNSSNAPTVAAPTIAATPWYQTLFGYLETYWYVVIVVIIALVVAYLYKRKKKAKK